MPIGSKMSYINHIPTLQEDVNKFAAKSAKRDDIRQMYGQIGLDIFEKKEPITIIEPPTINKFGRFINSLKALLGCKSAKLEYSPEDTMQAVLMKYVINKKSGTYPEIRKMFGKKGIEILERMKNWGYIE